MIHAGPCGTAGDRAMSPQWAPADEQTGDLLDLLADPGSAIRTPAAEWSTYVAALRTVAAINAGRIPANHLRVATRGLIKPSRIGAFCRRAQLEGLIVADGWEVSNDTAGRNAGRPARCYRWVGVA